MIQRKIVTAACTSAVFVLILSVIDPNPFQERVVAEQHSILSVLLAIQLYAIFSFPILFTYGIAASSLSDFLAAKCIKKTEAARSRCLLSGIFHGLFGLILLPFSLLAALLFFFFDQFLKQRNQPITWKQAGWSLMLPLGVWLLSIGTAWSFHWFG